MTRRRSEGWTWRLVAKHLSGEGGRGREREGEEGRGRVATWCSFEVTLRFSDNLVRIDDSMRENQ